MSKERRPGAVLRPGTGNNKGVMTKDTFQNLMARMGFGSPNMLEGTSYVMTRLTRNYGLLNTLYREHWIVRKIVDIIPEDMAKNWIKLDTQMPPESLKTLERVVRVTKTKERMLEGLKWGRLYGGAGALILVEGHEQLLETPLDLDQVMPGSYKGLLVLDRWSGLTPEAGNVTDLSSPDFGLPEYYRVSTQDLRSFKIHHSRLLRFLGNQLPLWESWAEQQWGASVIESVFDELKKRDNTSYNIAGLIFLANVRTYKTELADLLSFGDGAMQKDFYGVMQGINWMMNNFGMTVIGANDDFAQHQYTFTGINDVYESFMLDLAGACEIPVTRLFQRDPAGLNATGESDLTNYYDMIEEKQETYLRPALDKLLPVIATSAWGYVPEDLDYKFNPLRKADPKENADLSKSITDSVIAAFNARLISQQVALKEMRQQSELTGMWSNITDEDIARANADVDLGMGEMGGATGGGMELPGLGSLSGPLAGEGTPAPALTPGSLAHLVKDADWDESKHPRGGDPENSGRFSKIVGSGGQKGLPKKDEPAKLESGSGEHGESGAPAGFVPAKTIKEADEYARNAFDVQASYKGVDLEVANEWNKWLTVAFERFPELRNQFGFVGEAHERNKLYKEAAAAYFQSEYAGRFSEGGIKRQINKEMRKQAISPKEAAISWSSKYDWDKPFRGVTINRDRAKTHKALIEDLEYALEKKSIPEGCATVRYLLDHEVGHQLENMLDIGEQPNIQQLFDSRTEAQLTDDLSSYVWDNNNRNRYSEMIAEGWAEYLNNPNPRPMAMEIGKTIERLYDEWKKKNS